MFTVNPSHNADQVVIWWYAKKKTLNRIKLPPGIIWWGIQKKRGTKNYPLDNQAPTLSSLVSMLSKLTSILIYC